MVLPPCQKFSLASKLRANWKDGRPISEDARAAIRLVEHGLWLIRELRPRDFFMENPVGMMRTLAQLRDIPRHTVTYCQYGERYQKPTDIWTHSAISFKRRCTAGAPCHERAPRGSKAGIQGMANAFERGKLPDALCAHVARWCAGVHAGVEQRRLVSAQDEEEIRF